MTLQLGMLERDQFLLEETAYEAADAISPQIVQMELRSSPNCKGAERVILSLMIHLSTCFNSLEKLRLEY